MDQIFQYRGIERLIVIANDPILLWIGYNLFVLGATGRMTLSAKSHTVSGKITNLSPGVFCFLAAAAISVVALNDRAETDMKKTSTTESRKATGAAAGNTAPADTVSARQSTVEETKTSYETGAPNTTALSIEIRRRLSDAGLCVLNFGITACTKVVDGNFRKVPTEQDLKAIENLERDASQADNAARLQALRHDILNEEKK
jgi:hypothetical protein